MPPLRITNVIPIARIALIATCLTRIDRLPLVRNSGDSTEKTTPRTTSAMSARRRRTASCEPCGQAAPPPLDRRHRRRRRRQRLVGRVGGGDIGRDPAARHHQDARRAGAHLGQIGRREHDAESVSGQTPHRLENLRLGADVNAARRLVQQQHARPAHDSPARSRPSADCRRSASRWRLPGSAS